MKKKTARTPQDLARAIVDKRFDLLFSDLQDLVFLEPRKMESEDTNDFDRLVAVTEAGARASDPSYWATLDPEDLPGNLHIVWAQAGFLVGRELGRRLGPSR